MASTRSYVQFMSLAAVPLFMGGALAVAGPGGLVVPGSQTRLGCFTDLINGGRALSAAAFAYDFMTVERCQTLCGTGYPLFGLEYGRECYCGTARDASSVVAPNADCSTPCTGSTMETCGSANRIEVYSNDNYAPLSRAPATVCDAPYVGCFVDAGNPRSLPSKVSTDPSMTAAKCALNCAGFRYFGTQWGRECYCGDAPPATRAADTDCDMSCAGDSSELCGGSLRLTVYAFDTTALPDPPAPSPSPPPPAPPTDLLAVGGFEYQGCYTDGAPRVLAGAASFDAAMTVEKCAATCADFAYFGVEYATECYCGQLLDASSAARPEAECAMACAGNATQSCGGPVRLNVYKDPAKVVASPAAVDDFAYVSCWADDVANRALPGAWFPSDTMSLEACAADCEGYNYFGVEFGRECFCADTIASGAPAPETECSQFCSGNAGQLCGGPQRLNIYQKTVN